MTSTTTRVVKFLIFYLTVFASGLQAVSGSQSKNPSIVISSDFPGGNVIVREVHENTVRLSPDLRDTRGWWFYWYFSVQGAAGQTLRFVFEGNNPIGVRGPALSLDAGKTWGWMGTESVDENSFQFTFPEDALEVRFSFGMPYVQANLEEFLKSYDHHPSLIRETLRQSSGGRRVEKLRVGQVEIEPEYRVLLTCRHHACEMMASYTLEGVVAAVLADTDLGFWLRKNVEFLVIPFVDKDGVEQGDQGKNRIPRDHNRDYEGESLYPSVEAIRDQVPEWSNGRLRLSLDLHCPWIRGKYNEFIYFPGLDNATHAARLSSFAGILEKTHRGPLPFEARNNLPYGKGWNVAKNFLQGKTCSTWCSELRENRLAATLEIPYANASGAEVNAETARLLGHDLARAIRLFLEQEVEQPKSASVKDGNVEEFPRNFSSISGVFPHLAAVADHVPRTESGIGAMMPWADRLWFITYVAHTDRSGSGTGLFEIDEEMTLHKRPESVVGTYANRMIHSKSDRLIIGPHVIDTNGEVKTINGLKDHRLASTMEHLTDPANKVYFLTMEGLFFEVEIQSLAVQLLFDLTRELELPQAMRPHFKSGFTGNGRVVVANNTYDEKDFTNEGGGGRLAEWDGEEWRVLERTAFTEVSGDKNLSGAIFATGWDRASAILKIFVDGRWSTYRLPKSSHSYDHAWCTEWMRIREVETERLLMDCHGIFYELPYHLYDGKPWGIRPICSHLRMVPDFCSWRGLLVLGGNQTTPIGSSNPFAGQPQSNLWFGKTDDLWGFGKPTGWGGPWWKTSVKAGEPSVPFLMTGFDRKGFHLAHESEGPVEFKVEIDFLGDQSWETYATLTVPARGYLHQEFPSGFGAHWIRFTVDAECVATAYLMYN